jgi:archaellum component FlaC
MENDLEIKSLEKIVEKLDNSIDKLTEVSNNIGKLLAVHDQRINTMEKDTVRNEEDIRHIYTKLDSVSKELCSKIDQSMKNSTEGHLKIQDSLDKKLEGYDNRIKALEMWRWLVIGGALVIGWIVNRLFK